MTQVQLIAWNPGALGIPIIRAVRAHTGLGLHDAKVLIDAFFEGQPVAVTCPDAQSAQALLDDLHRLNVKARLLPPEPS